MATSLPSTLLRSDKLFSVEGLVVVITGGGSGLGLMMAHALAENGAAKVYIVGRREQNLREAAAPYPDIIIPLPGDVTSKDSLRTVAETIKSQTSDGSGEPGYINLLIANAGTAGPGLRGLGPRTTAADFAKATWDSSSPEDLDAVYSLNCTATYFTILAFLELLEEGNKRRSSLRSPGTQLESPSPTSQVIVVSSMVAFQRDPRYGFAYLGSKAAVVSMVKSFATIGVTWGIRFNSIAPGLFPTELSAAALNPFKLHRDKELTEEGAFSRAFLPAERAGSMADMAGALLYLASRAGSYVNGSVLLVDGGKLATVPATY